MTIHLDLEDLLGPPGEQARDHLDTCSACRDEAASWTAAAAGVHHLAGSAPSLPPLAATTNRPRRRRWPAAVAAGVVAAAGLGYGISAAGQHHPGTSAGAALPCRLTAVHGCPHQASVAGTVTSVSGTSLVVKSIVGHAPVTVTTDPGSAIHRAVAGSLRDVTQGSHVMVAGDTGASGLTAQQIYTGGVPLTPPVAPIESHLVIGTATSVNGDHFTVRAANGRHEQVTVSSATTVTRELTVSASQLQVGEEAIAVGPVGPGGTLAAGTIQQAPRLEFFAIGFEPGPGAPGNSCSALAESFNMLLSS